MQELEKKAFEAPNEAFEASKGHNMLVVQLSSQIVDLEEVCFNFNSFYFRFKKS